MAEQEKLKLPALMVGEELLWSSHISALELCLLEMSVGLFLLINCFGWVLILGLVMSAVSFSGAQMDWRTFALCSSGAIIGYVILWALFVFINDYLVSGSEMYAITNRRIMRVDRKATKTMFLDSNTLRVFRFRTFNDSGLIVFRDVQQDELVIVFCCRNHIDEPIGRLPPALIPREKRLSKNK
jgi:hypothetical protein